jgi:hypothetical protein
MTVALTGTGGWFTRRGAEFGAVDSVITAFGTQLDTYTNAIQAQYLAADQQVTAPLYPAEASIRANSYQPWATSIQQISQAGAIAQVNDDSPLVSQTLYNALSTLIAQMEANGTTIQQPVTSSTVTAGSLNEGDGIVVASLTSNLGVPLDMVFAENITLTVTTDTGNGGATQYQEPLQLQGAPAVSAFTWNYPQGSGASQQMQFVDGASTSRNLIQNGNFVTSSTNVPALPWVVQVGTPGTNVFVSNVSPLRPGVNYLRFTSDGSTLMQVVQTIQQTLSPLTVYVVNLFARTSILDAGGALTVKLINASGGTIANAANTALTITRNTNGQIGTGWTAVTLFIQTPALLPAGPALSIGISTTQTSGHSVDIDLVAMTLATQAYPGGPQLAAFAKDLQAVKGDTYVDAITTTATVRSSARALDRFYGLRTPLGLAFPSAVSGSASIPDPLATA